MSNKRGTITDYCSPDVIEMRNYDAREFIMLQTKEAYERLQKYVTALEEAIFINKQKNVPKWNEWTNYCFKVSLTCLKVVEKNNKILYQLDEPMYNLKKIKSFLRKERENYDYQKTGNEQAHRQKIREFIKD